MNPFPGQNSVLVMDNAKIHHHGNIAAICARAHVLLIYLPPYSPDFNPIEKVFSVLKSHLRRDQVLTGTEYDRHIVKDYCSTLVTPELMEAEYQGCGYL
jgi:transposase